MNARDFVLWDAWCSFIEWLHDLCEDNQERLDTDNEHPHWWD